MKQPSASLSALYSGQPEYFTGFRRDPAKVASGQALCAGRRLTACYDTSKSAGKHGVRFKGATEIW